MSDNSAVVKIIAKHTKEYNVLLSEHNTLLEVHTKTVDDLLKLKCEMRVYLEENADIEKERYDLRKLLKEAQKECRMVQQSLDDAQTEIERLNEKIETLYDCGDDLRSFHGGEGLG